MVRIEFDLETIRKSEAEDIVLMLNHKFKIGTVTTLQVASSTSSVLSDTLVPSEPSVASAPSAEGGTAGATAEPQPDKPKRGRPRKETPAEPENPTPAPTEALSGAAVAAAPSPELPSQPAAAGEAKVFTVDELRAGLQKFTVKHGMVKGKELLDSFGCARITELAEKSADIQTGFMIKCGV